MPTGANSDILSVTKSNSPQRCTSGSAFNSCVLQKRPKSNKCVIIVALENAKLKLLKVLPSYNNALYDSSKLFLQQLTLEIWGFWIFSPKCDVILRFRHIHVLLKCLLGEAGVNSTTIQCLHY